MNFTLRPWQMTDASVIAPYADDPLVAQNLRDVFPNPYTVADAEEFIRSCMEREGQGQMCRAIVADGKAVGSISLVLGSDGRSSASMRNHMPETQGPEAYLRKRDLPWRGFFGTASAKTERFWTPASTPS